MTPIPDRCHGSRRIIWSDDSYASYNEPCAGCEDCMHYRKSPERDHEEDAMPRGRSWEGNEGIRDELPNAKPKTPQEPTERIVKLSVSIPVRQGGYTGQREQWEEYEYDRAVALEGDNVILRNPRDNSVITFPKSGLDAALKILEDYKP